MPFSFQYRCQINILNKNNEYYFDSSSNFEKYNIYVTGFQLEQVNDDDPLIPDNYIKTNHKPIYMNMLSGLYKISGTDKNKTYSIIENNIHYFDSFKETRINDGFSYQYLITEYKPEFENLNKGDIALLPTIISFSNEENNAVVILGGQTNKSADGGSIYYDNKDNVYKIKSGQKYVKLLSNNNISSSLVHSIIYNQGYFETWSEQGEIDHNIGYNTGGGFNFFKKNKLGF